MLYVHLSFWTVYCTGFPTDWKIIENLENGKGIFQTWNLKKGQKSWKNHGISKYPYGKILEKSFYVGYFNCQNIYFTFMLFQRGGMETTLKG